MDDQEKQDDQRELLLEIAGCEIAKERLDNLMQGIADKHPCTSICKFQYDKIQNAEGKKDPKQEFSKAMFHVPEPWNGNLGKAEILFVSSNPSIDLDEDFPKFASEEWSEDKKDWVVGFFSNRLKSYKNRYWTGIRKYTAWILEENEEDKKGRLLLKLLSPKSYIVSQSARRESKRPLKCVSILTPKK